VAAVLAGETMSEVGARLGIDHSLISRWVARDAPSFSLKRAADIGSLLIELIEAHIAALHAQLQATSDPTWIQSQRAGELAQLVAAQQDGLIRLLSGLRPVQPVESALPPAT
jgi:hypothetical protein